MSSTPQAATKRIALLIAILALFLAFSETLGKSAQTKALSLNIKASDTWNFFQAKTIRQTDIAHRGGELTVAGAIDRPMMRQRPPDAKQIEAWRNTVDALRIRSEGKRWPQGIA